MIDQKDYQLLRTVQEQGSVQRAASAIGVSWPSVSKRLGKIEEKLNVQLFERQRGRNGITPLPALKSLLSEYEAFAKSLALSINSEKQQADKKDEQILKVGLATTIGISGIERGLALLERVGQFSVSDMSALAALDAVEKGDLDLCIVAEPNYAPIFKTYLIAVDPFQIAFPAGHRFESQNNVQISDLYDEDYVSRSLCEFPRYYREQTGGDLPEDERHKGKPIDRSDDVINIHTITNEVVAQVMIQQGHGVAVIPESLVVVQGLRTRALVRPSINRRIMLVARADAPVNLLLRSHSFVQSASVDQ